jgi:hypothetical protein
MVAQCTYVMFIDPVLCSLFRSLGLDAFPSSARKFNFQPNTASKWRMLGRTVIADRLSIDIEGR